MANANINFNVTGTDKTGAAFNAIGWRAKQLSSMLKGALAFAGAYFGFRAIKGGIDELGHLSDIAQKTSTNVGELTQTAAAMGALGIQNMGVDQLGKAFDYMAKTTGRSGMEGFYQTIGELGKIPDVAKRGQEAMRIFGGSGMEFMPLINAASEGAEALKGVIAAMPGVSQAAADSGDGASDAMGFAANQIKTIWLEGLGFLANKLNNDYTGDVRTAALKAGNSLEYYTKLSVQKCLTWYGKFRQSFKGVADTVGAFIGAFSADAKWYDWPKLSNPGTIAADFIIKAITGKETALTKAFDIAKDVGASALQEYEDVADELDALEESRTKRWEKRYEDRAIAIKHFAKNYNEAATSILGGQRKRGKDDFGIGASLPKVSNDLIMGGSNAATRLQLLGPTLQSEQKKTNALLEQVVENTKQTANNTEDRTGDELYALDT